MSVLPYFTGIILSAIAWQDFKFRAVYWWLFPLLLATLAIAKIRQTDSLQMTNDLLYNGTFLGIQLFVLSVYFSLKQGKWVNIFDGYFGLGDLFFLLSIAPYFAVVNYIFFYLLSLFAAIVLSLFKEASVKIPLAGQQAVALLLVMLADQMIVKLDVTSGAWLNSYLDF